MKRLLLIALMMGCGKDDKADKGDKLDMNDIKTESAVEFAEKTLPDIDAKLASSDPGAASSACSVIMVDYKRIEKAKPELAATLKTRCKRDVHVRSLAVEVEKMEKDKHECGMLAIYDKPIAREGFTGDPEVAKLHERAAAACSK